VRVREKDKKLEKGKTNKRTKKKEGRRGYISGNVCVPKEERLKEKKMGCLHGSK